MKTIEIRLKVKGIKKVMILKKDILQEENKMLLGLDSIKAIDVHNIGRFLFEIEKKIFSYFDKEKKKRKVRKDPLKIETVELPLLTELSEQDKEKLSNTLSNFFLFIYNLKIEFKFYKEEFDISKKSEELNIPNKIDSVLLFSGGLDSIIGTSYCSKKFKKTLLVYTDQKPRLKPMIEEMVKKVLDQDILIKVKGHQIYSGFFANMTGLSYILNGSIFCNFYKSPLIISECGVTSYQPRFGPLNEITYTTHPHTINTGKDIFEIFFKEKLDIIMPFNDSTKAEMITRYGDSNKIKLSHSCVTTNPFVEGKFIKNCGECYACTIRRLAIEATRDDPTEYKSKINWNKKQNTVPILDFCYLILKNFDLLDYPQKEKIVKYQKQNLFRRFALDTFATLYKISKKERLPDYILEYLSSFDKNLLEDRLKQLKIMKEKKQNVTHRT